MSNGPIPRSRAAPAPAARPVAGLRPTRRVEATATPTASFPGERGEIRRSAEATARPAASAPGDRERAPGGRRHRAGPA
ncbi:hypothetical protein SA87_09005 [Hydrogenibacillus schlegelii]|uniref:Uncharacterized protein n=1 Tax=Hydrogenibacillus schlegelii TaxID=1484 RepID=A0A179ISG6_HYDSH|nr:hypothetical protein SA87_09005 [Hydrogenibacillus schlegelii]